MLLVLLSVSFFHWKLQFLSLVYLGQITAVSRPAGMPDGKCSLLSSLAGHTGLIYSLLACGGCSESSLGTASLHEQREARLQNITEVKEKGFVWQMKAGDMPGLALQRCSVDPKLQKDSLLSLLTMLVLSRCLQRLVGHPYFRAALRSKYLRKGSLTCHEFEATK